MKSLDEWIESQLIELEVSLLENYTFNDCFSWLLWKKNLKTSVNHKRHVNTRYFYTLIIFLNTNVDPL